jgi:tight adherence protein B
VQPLGVFLAVTAGALAASWALAGFVRPGSARVRRRLAGEFASGATVAPHPLYTKSLDQIESDAGGEPDRPSPDGEGGLRVVKSRARVRAEAFLREAGLPFTVRQLMGAVLAGAVALGLAGFALFGGFGTIAGLALGAIGPVGTLFALRARRRHAYTTQLGAAFELMARVLRSGQTVPEAFRSAAGAFDEPLAGEFGRCLHQIEHGIRPEAAYRELSERAGVLELRIFLMAMTIQRQTGGNLSEMLDRLASLIRTRLRFRQKIRALTAEGRMQALTLTVFPFLTYGAMFVLNRPYAEALLDHGSLLLATLALMAVGVLWIRTIMSFEG